MSCFETDFPCSIRAHSEGPSPTKLWTLRTPAQTSSLTIQPVVFAGFWFQSFPDNPCIVVDISTYFLPPFVRSSQGKCKIYPQEVGLHCLGWYSRGSFLYQEQHRSFQRDWNTREASQIREFWRIHRGRLSERSFFFLPFRKWWISHHERLQKFPSNSGSPTLKWPFGSFQCVNSELNLWSRSKSGSSITVEYGWCSEFEMLHPHKVRQNLRCCIHIRWAMPGRWCHKSFGRRQQGKA